MKNKKLNKVYKIANINFEDLFEEFLISSTKDYIANQIYKSGDYSNLKLKNGIVYDSIPHNKLEEILKKEIKNILKDYINFIFDTLMKSRKEKILFKWYVVRKIKKYRRDKEKRLGISWKKK